MLWLLSVKIPQRNHINQKSMSFLCLYAYLCLVLDSFISRHWLYYNVNPGKCRFWRAGVMAGYHSWKK